MAGKVGRPRKNDIGNLTEQEVWDVLEFAKQMNTVYPKYLHLI
jgi:hypothetical protein